MPMRFSRGARWLAGALLFGSAAALVAEPIRVAAERPDGQCPGRVLGIVRSGENDSLPADAARCVAILTVADLSDAALDAGASRAGKLPRVAAVIVEMASPSDPASSVWTTRLAYAIKKLSSAIRGASPEAQVGYDLTAGIPAGQQAVLPDLELGPYIDAFVRRPDRGTVGEQDVGGQWLLAPRVASGSAAGDLLRALASGPSGQAAPTLLGLLSDPGNPVSDADWRSLERLGAYWTADVSRDPTATKATRTDGTTFEVLRFFDAKQFTPILLLPENPSGPATIELSGGPFAKASVENLGSGVKRDFDLKGAKTLTLDLSKGSLAVVLHPAARPGGETKAAIDVAAARGLTAEEIVARERAWDAAQRERAQTFVADMKTSLRFRIAEVNETFDLTIRGPFFYRRGEPPDWEWDEFFLNGVRWKGKTLPKLPILQPDKVTTLPLDIRLTEEYEYALRGEATIAARRAYHITYVPKSTVGEKPIYRGDVWIDKQTFGLLRRDSVQLNLKGETLSNVQTEFYRPVPGHPDVFLPLEIKGEQVFSTAGRTTAIERDVVMQSVRLNPPDFSEKRSTAYRSPAQMIRDTDNGMRYLVPDPARPGERVVEEKISKKSTFGILGGFYDSSLDYPLPALGIQHFDFDLWGKGKQLSIFFAGALATLNYTDPSLAGSRFDLGGDLFLIAVPFGDVSYRNGQEVASEKIKHLPATLQVNVGRPLGPYLKASLGLFTRWDDYQRDKDTGPNFVTPVDTFTDGAELRLVGNYSGFNATLSGSYSRRRKWEPWGDPATSEYDPSQKDYWKYSVSLSKDQYFPGFRKLHASIAYLGGQNLDRFSKYEFGAFSGNPIRGFKSGSLRTQNALLADVSYGLNIEDIIRLEGFYDQGLLTDRRSGFDRTYFSGAGVLASLNGPWKNSLVRADFGVPVVGHGVHGFVVNLILLKLF
jgi:hypothetical protein